VMVELRTRKWDMRGYVGNHHHGNRRLMLISCASQFTIPNPRGTSPDPGCKNTHTRLYQPIPASRTPDNSYRLVTSPLFSSSSIISLFLVHHPTINAEHKGTPSLSISPCHDHELAPRRAYTQYSIHPRLLHFPSFSWLWVDPWM